MKEKAKRYMDKLKLDKPRYAKHLEQKRKTYKEYVKMTSNCMGTGEVADDNKIVRNIMKEVMVEKENNMSV